MAKDIKTALHRYADTIVADALGAASLIVMLFGALSLPALF